MKKETEPNRDELRVDWFQSESDSVSRRNKTSGSEFGLRYFLGPVGDEYFSELPTLFLGDLEQLSALESHEAWIARDGLVPLLWFFHRFPDPRDLRSRIFIDRRFAAHIPDRWRPRTGTYDFGRLPANGDSVPVRRAVERLKERPVRLLITGILSRSYCGGDAARKILCAARSRMLKLAGREAFDVHLCLLQRNEPLTLGSDMTSHSVRMLVELAQVFGSSLRLMTLSEFYEKSDFSSYAVLDLNERLLCADSWMTHQAVQRGASLLDPPLSSRHARYISLDLRYGFGLQLHSRVARTTQTEIEREAALGSPANYAFSWKNWEAASVTYDSKSSSILQCPLTAVGLERSYRVEKAEVLGNIDIAILTRNNLRISGWSYDQIGDGAYRRVFAIAGSSGLPGETKREAREDIGRAFALTADASSKVGFTLSIPLECIPRQETVVWICVIQPSDRAQVLGCVKVWEGAELKPSILPVRDPRPGGAIEIAGEHLTVYVPDPESKAPLKNEYVFKKISGGQWNELCGWLDELVVGDRKIRIVGWAADVRNIRPPEALVLAYDGRVLLIRAPTVGRKDIAERYDKRLHYSGYELSAEAPEAVDVGKVRLFSVWEDGVAIEIPVASQYN